MLYYSVLSVRNKMVKKKDVVLTPMEISWLNFWMKGDKNKIEIKETKYRLLQILLGIKIIIDKVGRFTLDRVGHILLIVGHILLNTHTHMHTYHIILFLFLWRILINKLLIATTDFLVILPYI